MPDPCEPADKPIWSAALDDLDLVDRTFVVTVLSRGRADWLTRGGASAWSLQAVPHRHKLSRIPFENDVKQRNVDRFLNQATPRYVENAGFNAGRKGLTEQIRSVSTFGLLEALLEGLQDAVHRESVREGGRIDALEKRSEPSEISRALSRDARERGL